MKGIINVVATAVILCTSLNLNAQLLDNHSFEGEPMDAVTPAGWSPCNEFTTPDILPGPWGVYLDPSHGTTYVGLITRQDGTIESIGQRIPVTIKPKTCYKITMDIAHSYNYAGYTHPSKCKIWLSNSQCVKEKLIVETDLIEHSSWKTYSWDVKTENSYNYIIIEAYYPKGTQLTKGNILLDHIRAIKECKGA